MSAARGILLSVATLATGPGSPRNGLPERRDYRWRDPARVPDPEALDSLRAVLDRQAGYVPTMDWTPERREQAAETARQAAAMRKAARAPVVAAAEPEPGPVAEPVRCRKCTYPLGSVGHATSCGSVT
jgi:hypothetical protein